jgi:Fe-S cluster assembly iron-binding protein IscA
MVTTEKAAHKLQDILLKRCSDVGLGFRLAANTRDSSETVMNIQLGNRQPGDEAIESYGVEIFLDRDTAERFKDYELDYADESVNGFFLNRPGTHKANPV